MKKIFLKKKFLGVTLFAAGILAGTLLFGGLVWADLEAVFYGLTHLTNETFGGLSCPPLMTRSETAELTVTVKNTLDSPVSPVVRVEISTRGVLFTEKKQFDLAPGESRKLAWPVSAVNIDMNRFIFAKAYRYPDYTTSLVEDTCGILVVDAPLANGSALLAIWSGASMLSILAGLWLLEPRAEFPAARINLTSARRALAVAVFIGIILGIQGAWLPGILALVVVILLASILLLSPAVR